MKHSIDFEQIFMKQHQIVMVNVLYYMPDQRHLVNEFCWQTLDIRPKYPRIHKFLDFWRREIDAIIKEVTICDMPTPDVKRWRNGIVIPIKGNV